MPEEKAGFLPQGKLSRAMAQKAKILTGDGQRGEILSCIPTVASSSNVKSPQILKVLIFLKKGNLSHFKSKGRFSVFSGC